MKHFDHEKKDVAAGVEIETLGGSRSGFQICDRLYWLPDLEANINAMGLLYRCFLISKRIEAAGDKKDFHTNDLYCYSAIIVAINH